MQQNTTATRILKHKAHKLIEAVFPDRTKRYTWLGAHFNKVNFSKMDTNETMAVILCLESKVQEKFCYIHHKTHGKTKGMDEKLLNIYFS